MRICLLRPFKIKPKVIVPPKTLQRRLDTGFFKEVVKIKVKLLIPATYYYKPYPKGDVLDVEDRIAKVWIAKGICKPYTPNKKQVKKNGNSAGGNKIPKTDPTDAPTDPTADK